MRARGSFPSRSARSFVPTTTQAAPSLIDDELPAVTVPPLRNAGCSLAMRSSEASGRGPSSEWTVTGSPFGCGASTVTISSSKRPASRGGHRAAVRPNAKASWSSRETPHFSATFSPVWPMPNRWSTSRPFTGLTKSASRAWSPTSPMSPRGKPRSGLSITNGERLVDSTPPPSARSPSPTMIERAAWFTASRPEAQRRLTVTPGTSFGTPARSSAMRATLRLSSPAALVQPKKTSSISPAGRSLRATACSITRAARSSAALSTAPRRSGRRVCAERR